MDLGPPNFYQDVVADFINEGHFARHVRRMRVLYRERRSSLVGSIQKELNNMVEILGDEAGMHLAVRLLGCRTCDLEIAERAARRIFGSGHSRLPMQVQRRRRVSLWALPALL